MLSQYPVMERSNGRKHYVFWTWSVSSLRSNSPFLIHWLWYQAKLKLQLVVFCVFFLMFQTFKTSWIVILKFSSLVQSRQTIFQDNYELFENGLNRQQLLFWMTAGFVQQQMYFTGYLSPHCAKNSRWLNP